MYTKQVVAFALTLVVAAAALAMSVPSAGSEILQNQQPGPNQIIVVLTCTPNQGAGIRVNPFRRTLGATDTATWRRVGGFNGPYSIIPNEPFPWTLSNGGNSEGEDVTGVPPAGGVPNGVYSYSVSFVCNGETVVLDPRMEVPR